MGMYTELNISVELKNDIDKDIRYWLNMQNDCEYKDNDDEIIKNAPKELRGTKLACLRVGSYHFDGEPSVRFQYDSITHSYYLSLQFNVKNYDNEIDTLLKILTPYILSEGFIGYKRYEGNDYPTLLFMHEGKVKMQEEL